MLQVFNYLQAIGIVAVALSLSLAGYLFWFL